MTAGRGIAHSEQSPARTRRCCTAPSCGWRCRTRSASGRRRSTTTASCRCCASRARRRRCCSASWPGPVRRGSVHTALIGVDVDARERGGAVLPLRGRLRARGAHGLGRARGGRRELPPGSLCYLGTGRSTLRLRAETPSRLLLLGGIPFTEKIVMWWNFIARTGEEIAAARERWQAELAGEAGATEAARRPAGRSGPARSAPCPVSRVRRSRRRRCRRRRCARAAVPGDRVFWIKAAAISGVRRSPSGDRRLPHRCLLTAPCRVHLDTTRPPHAPRRHELAGERGRRAD